jgi:hypothetical protein
MNSLACASACHSAVSRLGGAFMVDPSVSAAAANLDLTFMELYIAGRAGVMGTVSGDAVASQLGLLNPDMVRAQWSSALTKTDPTRAADAYAECARGWGRARLRGLPQTTRLVALAERVVQSMPLAELPLVDGWRRLALADDAAGRLAQLLQTMREYRGAVHVQAVRKAGLEPVEAIVSGPDGPERAAMLGWLGPYPDATPLAASRAAAERYTDELASHQFEALDDGGRDEFAASCNDLLEAIRQRRS